MKEKIEEIKILAKENIEKALRFKKPRRNAC